MKIVMTMMIRDEIDIVAPMLEFHRDQGVDLVIVTDNASVDGTAELLQEYADAGFVELHHDPVHRKQQGSVVTEMARRAFTVHGADWVVNADADEFLVPLDRGITVRQALTGTPTSLQAFTVPVVNLVGRPADRGAGFDRLVWRDARGEAELVSVGIHAQPTPNAIHVGHPDVTVAQGNHFVSLESLGQPDDAVSMEVLHLPWRSFSQFEQKVLHAGRAYEASPDLRPSRNHHGMADYRRAKDGRLREAFALRLPTAAELHAQDRFQEDTWLHDRLQSLVGGALRPEALQRALDPEGERAWEDQEHERASAVGRRFQALERAVRAAEDEAHQLGQETTRLKRRTERLRRERDEAVARAEAWVPVRQDVARVGRRVAEAARRRLRR